MCGAALSELAMLHKQQGRTVLVLARDEVNEEDDDGDRQLHEGHGNLDRRDAAREARADAAQRYPAPAMYPSASGHAAYS